MTNINCKKACIYQKEGKCCYDSVLPFPDFNCQKDSDCAYCVNKEDLKDKLSLNGA